MRNTRHRKILISAFAMLVLLAVVATGQESRGRVQGNVTDPSQAAIVAAKVTLSNVNTGVETARETDAAGYFRFDFVVPGTYTLAVESPGFNRYIQENVVVLTAGAVTVNPELTVGNVTEAVTVTAEVASVQFNTSTMTTTVEANVLKDIPVIARNPFTLALLNPAVVNQYWDVSHRNPFYMWSNSGLDIGGSTGGKNDQLLDGVPTGVAARGSYNSPMDAVQEVVVMQNSVDAEFGFSAGGVLNLSMKSGTNDWHGTAFYFGRNPVFNAMANRITRDPSFIRNHIWGGTVGNPIKKNKLFNFFSYEHWRQMQPTATVNTVPTDLERSGDFSQTRTPQGALRPIYDPFSTVFDPATSTVTRTPFAGNRVPSARFDPTGLKAINDLWKPSRAGDDPSGINNFAAGYSWWHRYWNISDRVDYNHSDRLRMYFRYSTYDTRLDNPNWGGTRAVRSDNGGWMDANNGAADAIYMLSPATTLNFRFGFIRSIDLYRSSPFTLGEDVWADLWGSNNWWKPVTSALDSVYYPNFNFSGNGSASSGIGGWWIVDIYGLSTQANVTHTRGRHTMKVGYQWRKQWEQNGSPGPNGFTFNSIDTGSSFLGYNASQSGSQFASALLGVVNQGSARISPLWDMSMYQYGLYFQDDIRLNRRVTLNLGLRWEYETAPTEATNLFSRYLDLSTPIPELQNITMPSEVRAISNVQPTFNGAWIFTDDTHRGVYGASKKIFLPRAGIAVRINDRTSFRAGYARFATPIRTIYTESWDIPKNGYTQVTNVLGPIEGMPRTLISNPFPSSNPLILPPEKSLGAYTVLGTSASWFNQELKPPTADRINFSLQRQLPASFMLDSTFFMHFGHNVHDGSMWGGNYGQPLNMMDPNLAYTHKGAVDAAVPNPFYNLLPETKMPGELRVQETVSVSQLLRPYPQFTNLNMQFRPGISNRYYALQLQAIRSMVGGWNLILGYNYNREIHSEFFNDPDLYAQRITMIDRRRPRSNLRIAGTYELPFGRGRKYASGVNRAVDMIIGGWATSHWFMFQGGQLLTFNAAQVNGDPTSGVPSGRWFNPDVFTVLPAYTPRTNPWYYSGLRGPRFWNLDSTLVKYTPITEKVRLELRFEFYNTLNHFIPSNPDMGVGSGTMGISTWVFGGNYGREVQYTARFHF
ncbi:MAG: TonB-dependent receptor [Bryobacteraceae bacterium]|nr:TonB-dependent receptor [Bryobacteraceae bacterium]